MSSIIRLKGDEKKCREPDHTQQDERANASGQKTGDISSLEVAGSPPGRGSQQWGRQIKELGPRNYNSNYEGFLLNVQCNEKLF